MTTVVNIHSLPSGWRLVRYLFDDGDKEYYLKMYEIEYKITHAEYSALLPLTNALKNKLEVRD